MAATAESLAAVSASVPIFLSFKKISPNRPSS
jgi:hypothetical protein